MSAAGRKAAAAAAVGTFGRVSVTLLLPPQVEVVDRRDIRTRESQPYHAAQGLDLAAAEALIQRTATEAEERATADLAKLRDDLAATGVHLVASAVVVKRYRLPSSVEAILRSHPLCHAAEGQMTSEALLAACDALGLAPVAALDTDLDPDTDVLTAAGKSAGPPWRKDHRLAAAAALLAGRDGRP